MKTNRLKPLVSKVLFCVLAVCAMQFAAISATAQDIVIDATNFPDANFRAYLLEQDYGKDGVITAAEINSITSIKVNSRNI